MLTVILTRHGETDRSHPEQYMGQHLPAKLTEPGRAAARALGSRLKDQSIDRVISSPLSRAVDTARLVRPNAPIETDDRLAEADYGDWEGHTIEEIEARWPEERQRYDEDPARFGPPNGENGRTVARRLRALLRELVGWSTDQPADTTVLLVGHSTVNRVMLAVVLGVPLRDYRRRFRQDWANLTMLAFDEPSGIRAELLVSNDTSHSQQ